MTLNLKNKQNKDIIHILTRLPFGLEGEIYRSPMPYSIYDPTSEAYSEFKQMGITVVVILVNDNEAYRKSGRDLKLLYKQDGRQVIYLPIEDFGVPEHMDCIQAIDQTIALARERGNIVIHCSAGKGRTGLFVASMVKKLRGLTGQQALDWTRCYIPGAVETPRQEEFVMNL